MKIKVGLIFGGNSTEHEVSIISALQAKESFDLEKYAGKNCLHKKYYVSSKKIYPEKYVANILTYENKLIGGDLHSQYYKQKLLKLKSIC